MRVMCVRDFPMCFTKGMSYRGAWINAHRFCFEENDLRGYTQTVDAATFCNHFQSIYDYVKAGPARRRATAVSDPGVAQQEGTNRHLTIANLVAAGMPKLKRGRPVKPVPMTFTQYAKDNLLVDPVRKAAARDCWYASRKAERLRGRCD